MKDKIVKFCLYMSLLLAFLSVLTDGKFRPRLAWVTRPEFSSYEIFQIAHDYIKISWIPAQNNGF